jgi:hypothetical protein
VGIIAAGVQLAVLIPIFVGLQHAAVVGAVKASIANDAASRGVTIASVECPAGASLSKAATFECLATRTTGMRDLVVVTVSQSGRLETTLR